MSRAKRAFEEHLEFLLSAGVELPPRNEEYEEWLDDNRPADVE